ncbi:MAG TPA: hypothetical protein VNT79_03420 [Phycisphaerae bacterium]|nr:hypothetical protein [Phycisphaerae bacterium]
MSIVSGPTTERIVRNGLFFLMIAGFGVAFLYDGYRGYPAKNFDEHIASLDIANRENARSAPVYPAVTVESADTASKVSTKFRMADQREALAQLYSGPPSFETAEAIYYFGPDYRMKFPIAGGKLQTPVGSATKHNRTDIRAQKMLGWLLAGGAALVSFFLAGILLTNFVLDDAGIRYRFKGAATWDQMKSLESSRFTKKGWVDLVCDKGGAEKRMRLDEYHLKRFTEIIAEICRRNGFEDPVAKEKAFKAQQAGA